MSQLVFRPGNDPWCRTGSQQAWDGLDMSLCFHAKIVDGILPIIFIGISASALLYVVVMRIFKRPRARIPLAKGTARRLSVSSQRSRASQAQADERHDAATGIAEAENEVILQTVLEQSPDLKIADLLKLTGRRKRSSKNGYLSLPTGEDDDSIDSEDDADNGAAGFFGGVWRCKKDIFNVLGSGAVVGLLAWRLVELKHAPGSNWRFFPLAAWAWTTFLCLVKLAFAFVTALRSDSSKMPQTYSTLELHIIPYYMLYAFIAFFDFRTALLSHDALGREVAIFVLVLVLTLVEFAAPRPSRFLPRGTPKVDATGRPVALELNRSLLSLTLFTFVDSFLFRYAFAKTREPVTLQNLPDLRPNDKTARILLSYRTETAWISKRFPKAGTTTRLFWFFRGPLLLQQAWSLLRVSTVTLPSMLLQAFLAHLGKMKRGEDAPAHVAILIIVAMFVTQCVSALAQSQSLYIGRRIAINLRSVLTGEIFTKALRRKDQAGSSVTKTEEQKAADVEAAAAKADKKLSANGDGDGDDDEEGDGKASSGKIINLVSVDVFRVSELCAYMHYIFPELSLTIVICVVLLFRVLGLSALAGLITMILISPLSAASSKLFMRYQDKLLKAADARLNLATEVISSVRMVKYFAWERKFMQRMDETREKELKALWRRAVAMIYGNVLFTGTPIMVSTATFVVHTQILHKPLTAEAAFTSLSLFNILRGPLEGLVDMVINLLQSYISIKRIDGFLREEETAKFDIIKRPTEPSDERQIGFSNATFTWASVDEAKADPSIFRIADLELNFPVGKMSIILGPVGSGKTTLLLSLLGETNCLEGASFLPSPIIRRTDGPPSVLTDATAYCSQSPWLLSDTIKENIVFGSAWDEDRYKRVLHACALEQDLQQFDLGDLTEVGEKGTVLSGGQKARISLARAVYSPARHLLLDDVLSAVDSHTGQHLFEKCFKGKLMRHRTLVLVTHAVDLCLPGASYVVSMEHGRVTSSGPPSSVPIAAIKAKDDLATEQEQALASAITIEAIADGETDDEIRAREAEEERKRKAKNKLIQEETQAEGAVSREVYKLYIRAMGGWIVIVASFVIYMVVQFAEIAVSLALRYWAQAYDEAVESESATTVLFSVRQHVSQASSHSPIHLFLDKSWKSNPRADFWLRIYVLVGVSSLLLTALRSGYTNRIAITASRTLYVRLMDAILGAPIRFFDSTPTGRILNRLSKDMETVDQDLAPVLQFFFLEALSSFTILVTIVIALPKFVFAAILIVITYSLIGYIYIGPSRDLKRCESVSKSPIISLFTETLNGVATIRAYGDFARFARQAFAGVDANNRPFFLLWQTNRWLAVRVDIAGAFVTLLASLFVLWAGGVDASLAGFIVSFAMAFNDRCLWVVRMYSVVEINFNSLERVREYLELDQESKGGEKPPAIWPSREGKIEVEGLTASYAPDLPPVLKNVSFTVAPREKVGICGRTGSGKSTLGLSFFRFIEPSSGQIKIDGRSINELRLDELRSRLTIVAQEAALFAGTLRFNLDPFNQYEDKDIWDALRRVHLASERSGEQTAPQSGTATPRAVTNGAGGVGGGGGGDGSSSGDEETTLDGDGVFSRTVVKSLDMPVTEGGKNFSAGQRQLISLCRGLLKLRANSHILILDESTASLDSATDDKIQETIRAEMSDATILCIAHRLRTIIDYDKILVLGDGQVLEYAAPWDLLDNEQSSFSALCRKSGEYDVLKRMAEAARAHHSSSLSASSSS